MLLLTRAFAAALLALPSARPAPADSHVVAVMPLTVSTRDTLLAPLAFCLADLLAVDLARSKQLTLVERARLSVVLRELSLAASGAVDSATAPRTGRLLNARTLVTGALARQAGDRVVFAMALRDVGSGRVEQASEEAAPLATILDAEKALVLSVFDHLGVQLTPQERALVEARPTNSLVALVAYGQGVRAEINGQYGAAARAFRRASAADPAFHEARARADAARSELSHAAVGFAGRVATTVVNPPLAPAGAGTPSAPTPSVASAPSTSVGASAAPLRPNPATGPEYPSGQTSITVHISRP